MDTLKNRVLSISLGCLVAAFGGSWAWSLTQVVQVRERVVQLETEVRDLQLYLQDMNRKLDRALGVK